MSGPFFFVFEQISLCYEWEWRRDSDMIVYRIKIGDTAIEVKVAHNRKNQRFRIETRRGKTMHSMRRRTIDCIDDLTLGKMKQNLRSVLSRYVSNER